MIFGKEITANIDKLVKSYKNLNIEQAVAKMRTDGIADAEIKATLASQHYTQADIEQAIATNKSNIAKTNNVALTKAQTVGHYALAAGAAVAKVALASIGTVLVSMVATNFISWLDGVINRNEKLAEAAEKSKAKIDELFDTFNQKKSEVEDISKEYAELAQGVDQLTGKNVTLSDDEYKEFLNLSNQLADLFPSLTKNYDENGNAIVDLTGDVNSIVSSLDALIKKEQELTNQKILDEMPDVYADLAYNVSEYNKQLDSYKLFKDSIPSNIEVDIIGKTSFKLNDDYYLDKDITKYIKDKFSEKFEEYELENAIANVNYGHDGVLEFNITGLKNTQEYREKLNKIYDEIRIDLIKKIQEINSSIETEMDGFNEYVYTWLSSNWNYSQMSESLQSAVQQILYNSNWMDMMPSTVDSSDWDQVSEWLEANYLNAINNINDDEYKQKLANLFTMDLDPQDKIDLANELQAYFDEHDIKVSLDFITDGNKEGSDQNLVNRMNANRTKIAAYDPDGYNKLKEYTKGFSDSQMNHWLEVTDGVYGADNAIRKFEDSLKRISDEDLYFFTDDNLEAIDEYKNKISDLGKYLESIDDDGILTSEELSTLNTEYGIIADSVDGYKEAIIKLMNETASDSEIMNALAEAIESCNDAATKEQLQSLYDNLKGINQETQVSADSFGDLNTAITALQGKAELLRDINESYKEVGYIDSSKLDDIVSTYPQLVDMVAQYNAGLVTSAELFAALEEAYENDKHNYEELIVEKLKYDEQFYNNVVDALPDWLTDLAEAYGIDFNNFKNLCETKLALEKEMLQKMGQLESARVSMQNLSDTDPYNDTVGVALKDAINSDTEKEVKENFWKAKKSVSDIQTIIDEIDKISVDLGTSIDLDWNKYGKDLGADKDGKDKDSESTTEIDWAEQSLKVLQEAVDDAQTALEDTHGFDDQIDAINALNDALKSLRGGYKKVKKEYSDRYTAYLSQLPNGETIKGYIESGKKFNLKEYDSDTAEIIQAAIDAYNNMIETENKITELDEQIDDNTKLEKSKVRQEKYETKLAGIQTDLDNDNLSAAEKNALLDKQLKYQQKINAELIKQAKYEGDILEVENLKKEDKKNERDTVSAKWQYKIDENQTYIDAQNAKLEDGSLTEKEIDQTNDILEGLTKTDYKYKFKDIIAGIDEPVWKEYIKNLKKQYKQKGMKDKDFIEAHLEEISQYFNYTGMEELYYEYINSMDDFNDTDYETHKNTRSYYINDNNNKIANIQSDIDYAGGRGTEQQYLDMQALHKDSIDYWTAQKEEAQSFLNAQTAGTAEWDKWNSEVQECQENIDDCNRSIKDCNISILKLPLNDVEDALTYIQNQLNDINESIENNNTYISAANYILDEKIKAQEKSKEVIQDEIDRLEKANELRQVNLNLQKAEYALEKAKNQRSSKIFKEGQGWVFESDADEIRSAQEQYDQALFDKKIHSLNEQINIYDEEIARLNDIKEYWNQITTDAQGVCDINKAIAYDSDFINKVLTSDAGLIANIANSMISLYTTKSLYEEQQSDYQKLQEIINETATQYDLEAIDYQQARQKISSAIQTYYPEVFEKYSTESEKLQEIIDKKLEDAGITEETSEDINTAVDKSNEKLLESYTALQEDLSEVFGKLNLMLDDFSKNAQNMVATISDAISKVQSQLNSLSSPNTSMTTTLSVTSSTITNKTTSSKQNNKKKSTTKTAGKSHSGLELGYIGESTLSQDKKDFKYIALSELKDDEIVRVLQKGEGVTTEGQIQNVMSNFRKITQAKIPTLLPHNIQSSQSVSFNGDIIVQGVQNVDGLAKAIKTQLPNAMLQQLYSNK